IYRGQALLVSVPSRRTSVRPLSPALPLMPPSRPGGRQGCYKLPSVAHHVNRHALELAGAEHLPYAPRRELEDTGGLVDAVEVLCHTSILPSEWGSALAPRSAHGP